MSARTPTTHPTHWGTWPAWLDRATADGIQPACRGATALYFPGDGKGTMRAIQQAKAICGTCPLLATCRDWALQQPARWLYGVWGGLSQYERIALAPRNDQPDNLRQNHN
ncbi:WhiB family transcriptional regulator [Micromonospora sp. NPDC023633]|uniref:WhiB family transcriptional regulator n=1 Tax=Micromonospora sp. NPDC023633 TaxID=3154320 RepID=UPI00340A639E